MPTNVSPEYKKAQEAYRAARDPADRLTHLKEMLSTIPKHKGTEHLQADIKTRIKEITDELAGPRKTGVRTGPVYSLRPEGAAQVSLVGPTNSGKSSLHKRLTGSQAEVGPYPNTTHALMPGMFPHEDIQFQLIDLPPISADYMETWMPNALQPAHAVLLVVDLGIPGCVENVVAIREKLEAKRITLVEDWSGQLGQGWLGNKDGSEAVSTPPPAGEDPGTGPEGIVSESPGNQSDPDELEDPFRIYLPTLLVVNKSDLGVDPEEVEVLQELAGVRYPALAVSAETGEGLARLGSLLFRGLGIARIYTKVPGKPPDMEKPYTLFPGETVQDLARLIHRDLASSIKSARIWGSAKFDGQQVGKEFVLADKDVVELRD